MRYLKRKFLKFKVVAGVYTIPEGDTKVKSSRIKSFLLFSQKGIILKKTCIMVAGELVKSLQLKGI